MRFFQPLTDFRKKALVFILALLLLLGAPSSARAQLLTHDPIADSIAIWGKTKELTSEVYKNAGRILARTVVSTLQNFLKKLAYDSATWLASGDYNKKPMFVTEAYWKNAADEAAGDAIYNLGNNIAFLKKYGIDLCVPQEPEYQLKLKLQLLQDLNPRDQSKTCRLSEIKRNYERIKEPGYWNRVGVGFEPGQSGLSLALKTQEAINAIKQDQYNFENEKSQNVGALRPKTDAVSQKAVSPTAVSAEAVRSASPATAAEQKQRETESFAKELGEGSLGALTGASKLFLDTLSNKLNERLFKMGLLSVGSLISYLKEGSSASKSEAQQQVGLRQAVEASFSDLLTPTLSEVESYPYLGDLLSSCLAKPSPFCEALDDSFSQALAEAEAGNPLTVEEAVKKNLLHGDWKLMPPGPCEKQSYCYHSLVKLRIFRILPLGWELAAKLSLTDQKPLTLNEALAAFYGDKNNKYYHLVDPNWILKAPKTKCGAMAYGSLFLAQPTDDLSGERSQYCADIQHCVGENDKTGQCDSWGYCLREKNIWRLGGDVCEEQFNTCTTYTDSQGQSVSYLANTIDRGICSADNAGCRAYAVMANWKNDKWQWEAKDGLADKVYFNSQAEQCGLSNEGCSKFIRLAEGVKGEALNFKKAPSYYNCYGENTANLSAPSSQWAANKADLYKIFTSQTQEQKEQCQRFANLCSAEEVGCELYTSVFSAFEPAVPGILTSADQCPDECIGYAAYAEQPLSQFSSSASAYFIPATAQFCSAENIGCEEFINLEAAEQGGETKEYYTELRACGKDKNEGEVYYTWEGSDTAGYQLKSYSLKSSPAGPAYNTADPAKLKEYQNICNAEKYKLKAVDISFNSDCREFYDKNGNKSYRLHSKTVTISPTNCQTLRKSFSDPSVCSASGGVWDAAKGFCVFLAIPQEGRSCPAAAVGCRAYKGNAGNNFQIFYQESFESGAVGKEAAAVGWSGKYSAEATVVGGKSLKADKFTETKFSAEKGKTYLLSFWAKGAGDGLTATFQCVPASQGVCDNQENNFSQDLKLNSEWQTHTIGPFSAVWDPSAASTTIRLESSGVFFVDNIVGKEMIDNIYVKKDSWITPFSCDNLIGDPLGENGGGNFANPLRLIPQAQLGCQAYANRQGQKAAVKSFTNLCREEAVGCEKLLDTFNTETGTSTLANVLCELSVLSSSNQAISCKDKNGEERCLVQPNQKFCRFTFIGDKDVLKNLADSDNQTKETKDAEGKLYSVTIKTDAQTREIPADRQVYLVNDSRFQCADDNLGCRALGPVTYDENNQPQTNSTVYLKDQPDNYAQTICESRAEGCEQFNTPAGSQAYFKNPLIFGNKLCEWTNPIDPSHLYGGWVKKGGKSNCNEQGGGYNIWTVNDPEYQGAVGLCPAEQDGCSEFIDPRGAGAEAKTAENLPGQRYYSINNEKIDRGSCQGQASLAKGCVLFNETSRGTLTWNASATYAASQAKQYEKVNPLDCQPPGQAKPAACGAEKNDANVVLKVRRDRVCGQWLACASSMKVSKDGAEQEICAQLKQCEKASTENSNNDVLGRCAKWAKEISPVVNNEPFKIKDYQNRSVDFGGRDFSGYSLPEAKQIANLKIESDKLENINLSCRGFASSDAPLDSDDKSNPDKFCSFAKVVYSGGNEQVPQTKYFPYNTLLGSEGVCDGGYDELGNPKKGQNCSVSADCSDDRPKTQESEGASASAEGVCLTSRKVTREQGWTGYCLIKDPLTRACALWYPLATPSGAVSLYNLNQSAGYFPPDGAGKYWCVEAKGNANLPEGGASYVYNLFRDSPRFFPPTADGYNANNLESAYSVCERPTEENPDPIIFPSPTTGSCTLTGVFGNSISINEAEITNLAPVSPVFHVSEIMAVGLKPTKIYDNDWPAKEILLFRDQRLAGVKNIKTSNNEGLYWSGPLKKDGANWSMEAVWVEDKVQPKEIPYNKINKDFCELYRKDVGSSLMAFKVMFDSNGRLVNFRSKICDMGSNRSGMRLDLKLYLTEVCSDIRQVVEEDAYSPLGFSAKARTDRIWHDSGYKVGHDAEGGKLSLPYNQLFIPFGSFNQAGNPVTSILSEYTNSLKSDFDKRQALKKAGYWPIWMSPGGATPLNCAAGKGVGDCGKIGLCQEGPNKGNVCKVDADPANPSAKNGCAEILQKGECKIDANKQTCQGDSESGKSVNLALIACGKSADCQGKDFGPCQSNMCNKQYSLKCENNDDCKLKGTVSCFADQYVCVGGKKDKMSCDKNKNDDCPGGMITYACAAENNIRGLCVGGSNHELPCGSSKDCPLKKYLDSGEEVIEYGVCVGSSLDQGSVIPQSTEGFAFERLSELFTRGFGTWQWNKEENRYEEHKIQKSPYDDSKGNDALDKAGNSEAGVYPVPPQIYSLKEDKSAPSGFTWGKPNSFTINKQTDSGVVDSVVSPFAVTLDFFAFADNDQMPLQRIAIDWGDGSDAYAVRGWFKNRKPWCETENFKVCGEGIYYNMPCVSGKDCGFIDGGDCQPAMDNSKTSIKETNRLYFGNSSPACDQGYFTFRHVYECDNPAGCSFIPRVQVLDNWGWCNGTCDFNEVKGGCWSDMMQGTDKQFCSIENSESKDKHWTTFNGKIEIKPKP